MSVQWIDDDRTHGTLGQQVRRLSSFCPPYAGPARWHFWITVGGHAPTETYLANATQDQALVFAGKLLQAQVNQFQPLGFRPPIVHVRADRHVSGDSWCVAFALSSQVEYLQPLSGVPEETKQPSTLGKTPDEDAEDEIEETEDEQEEDEQEDEDDEENEAE